MDKLKKKSSDDDPRAKDSNYLPFDVKVGKSKDVTDTPEGRKKLFDKLKPIKDEFNPYGKGYGVGDREALFKKLDAEKGSIPTVMYKEVEHPLDKISKAISDIGKKIKKGGSNALRMMAGEDDE